MINKEGQHKNNHSAPTTQNQLSITTSPLPHPDILLSHDRVRPGLSEEIIQMVKEQVTHRINLENKKVDWNIQHIKNVDDDFKRGQYLGFLLGLLTMGCGTWVAISGHDLVGAV